LHDEEISELVLFARYNDHVKKDQMCRACSTHGREKGCIQGFGGEIQKKRD
jgi:hypothetical protein